MKTGLSGWLYAYETPPPPPSPMSRSESPELNNIVEENNGSLLEEKNETPLAEETPLAKETMESVLETPLDKETPLAKESVLESNNDKNNGNDESAPASETCNNSNDKPVDQTIPLNNGTTGTTTGTETHDNGTTSDADELMNQSGAKRMSSESKEQLGTPKKLPTYCSPAIHGFLFAVHRKTVRELPHVCVTNIRPRGNLSIYLLGPCLLDRGGPYYRGLIHVHVAADQTNTCTEVPCTIYM